MSDESIESDEEMWDELEFWEEVDAYLRRKLLPLLGLEEGNEENQR